MSWFDNPGPWMDNPSQEIEESGMHWQDALDWLEQLVVGYPQENEYSPRPQASARQQGYAPPQAPYTRPQFTRGNYTSPWGGSSQFTQDMLEVNPESSYQQWTRAVGAQPNTPFDDYLRGEYGRYQQDYYGKAAKDPGTTWLNYLDSQSANPSSVWGGLSPRQRGESQGRVSGGRGQFTFPK